MSSQEGLCFLAFMSAGSIPDQNDLAGQVLLDVLECGDHLITLDGTFKMTLVDLARHRQGNCRRQNPPIACHSPQDGPLALASPGGRQRFQVREAKFIKEHDDCAELQRLFLSLASLLPARPSPALRRARRHVAGASEHCSPSDPVLAPVNSGDNRCQIPS